MNQQESEWAGQFGAEYSRRSPGDPFSNRVFFIKALGARIVQGQIQSVIEFGAGTGANLQALRQLLTTKARIDAVEINGEAMEVLLARGCANVVYQSSMLSWTNPKEGEYDLAMVKGVLIHIPPKHLPMAYQALYTASRRFILLAEYFAPTHTEIEYRGRRDMLWKGPHAYEMLDAYPDLRLLEYGFVSKRDPHPQDDLNWWLLEKGK